MVARKDWCVAEVNLSPICERSLIRRSVALSRCAFLLTGEEQRNRLGAYHPCAMPIRYAGIEATRLEVSARIYDLAKNGWKSFSAAR